MKYDVTAKRFVRDPEVGLMTADKRVHINLTHAEADTLYKRYVRGSNQYWHQVRMKKVDINVN